MWRVGVGMTPPILLLKKSPWTYTSCGICKTKYDQNKRWYSFCYVQSLRRSTARIRGENDILTRKLNTVKKEVYIVF